MASQARRAHAAAIGVAADVCGLAALTITVAAMTVATDASVLFKLHPILNAVAFAFLMGKAMTAYYGHALPCWEAGSVSRASRRRLHRLLSVAAFVCAAGALVAIISSKVAQNKSIIPRSVHGWCGIIVFKMVCLQAWVGATKFAAADAGSAPVHKWHGLAGQIIHGLGMAVLVLGVALMLGWYSGWTVAVAIASAASVLLVNLHLQIGRSVKDDRHDEVVKKSDDADAEEEQEADADGEHAKESTQMLGHHHHQARSDE
jgi:hypothetical protein